MTPAYAAIERAKAARRARLDERYRVAEEVVSTELPGQVVGFDRKSLKKVLTNIKSGRDDIIERVDLTVSKLASLEMLPGIADCAREFVREASNALNSLKALNSIVKLDRFKNVAGYDRPEGHLIIAANELLSGIDAFLKDYDLYIE
ncbi:MAG: hypothetical protein LBB21_05225 [Holosporaceae bacterium]|jgi:hypothetical protein|nr:hypothetical protein [Holosporaceae bacterium]